MDYRLNNKDIIVASSVGSGTHVAIRQIVVNNFIVPEVDESDKYTPDFAH